MDEQKKRPMCGHLWLGRHGEEHECNLPEHGWETSHRCECTMVRRNEPDSVNDFGLGTAGTWYVFASVPRERFSRAQAVRLAAWLLALTGAEGQEFWRVYDAVSAAKQEGRQ